MKTTGDQQLVKRINRCVLLRLLRAHGGLSRTQLAAASGLTKSTVGLLVRELIDEGWLAEDCDIVPSGLGRPSTPLRFDGQTRALIGVELGVETLQAVGVSLTGQVLCALTEALADSAPQQVSAQAAQLVARMHQQLAASARQLSGVGLGLPGAFDAASGMLRFAPNLGWRDVDFGAQFVQALGHEGLPQVPVHVQNEADTAALGEYEFAPQGEGQAPRDALIFVTCSTGVGAGIVLDDRLFAGSRGMAGEIGHSILQIDGALCSCGRRGCAETFIGARALARMSDPGQDGGRYLGIMLQNLWTAFDPGVLVVGGSSCERYPAMVQVAQEVLQHCAASAGMLAPTLRPAHYGLQAAAVGAAALVLHHELRPIQLRTAMPAPPADPATRPRRKNAADRNRTNQPN